VRPEDFIVEEIPLYEPSDEGPHVYLRVQKEGVAHGELMSCLRRHFGVEIRDIGYAGMKDKHAVTRQTVSLPLREDPPDLEFPHDRIHLLWASRHRNKIQRGHLVGNRFAIRIRETDPLKAPLVMKTLRRMERTGMPAYYGSQRFGYRRNNHLLGAMLLHERWDDMLAELLGTTGTAFPEHQRERRELFDAGEYAEAAARWSAADRTELIATKALARGERPIGAIRAIGRITLNFFASSLSSAAFNRLLDARIAEGTVDKLLDGDRAWKHDSRATFPIDTDLVNDGSLPPRLEAFEISPTGPVWGKEMPPATGAIAERELEALTAAGVSADRMERSRFRPAGARRAFRAPLTNIDVEGGTDEHGGYIKVVFDLPRGMYATVALREVMEEKSRKVEKSKSRNQGSSAAVTDRRHEE